jgi:putative hydrolase of the HAD superfamily
MSRFRVALVDVDGVLVLVPKYFSHVYAEEKGLDKDRFDKFFATYRDDVAKGKTNYRQLIIEHNDVWEWDKSPDELLERWFKYENFPNNQLITIFQQARKKGLRVYLASDQDKYRAKYLKENMFKDLIDGAFISSELRHNKIEPEFFKLVLAKLLHTHKDLKPSEVIYIDDSQHNIASAKQSGIVAFIYKSPEQVKSYLEV